LLADSKFWLFSSLLSDLISQDHFYRIPRDRSQRLLLFLLQHLLSSLLWITHFFPNQPPNLFPAHQAFS
jgi:hypothetical protein